MPTIIQLIFVWHSTQRYTFPHSGMIRSSCLSLEASINFPSSLDDGRAVGVGLQRLLLLFAQLHAVLAGAVTLEGLGEPERQLADEAHQDRLPIGVSRRRRRLRLPGRRFGAVAADREHSIGVDDGLVTLRCSLRGRFILLLMQCKKSIVCMRNF